MNPSTSSESFTSSSMASASREQSSPGLRPSSSMISNDPVSLNEPVKEPVKEPMKLDVLGDSIGYIELLEQFGDERTIVNAARVSFGTQKETLNNSDIRLLRYLYRHKHFSPFRHVLFRFRIKAPEFVMRQLFKHIVGIEVTSTYPTKDTAWNELSGRYKPVQEYYLPTQWRKQSASSKQASDGYVESNVNNQCNQHVQEWMQQTQALYSSMLDQGVAREQARILLPLNQYTEVVWTASAQAVLNLIELRDEPTAQEEIRLYAQAIRTCLQERCPTLADIWFEE
jgi:thymidylate synthase (FAD)